VKAFGGPFGDGALLEPAGDPTENSTEGADEDRHCGGHRLAFSS